MARRRSKTQTAALWDLLRFLGVLAVIALVVGYVYGSMALDFISAREEGSSRGFLALFGLGVERDSTPTTATSEPAAGEVSAPEKEPAASPAEPTQELPDARLEPVEVFRVQLGSFSNRSNAEHIAEKLAKLDMEPYITSGPPYKVWVGVAEAREPLNELAESLKAAGFEVFIGSNSLPAIDAAGSGLDPKQAEDAATLLRAVRQVLQKGSGIWAQRLKTPGAGEEEVQELNSQLSAAQEALTRLATDEQQKTVALVISAVEAADRAVAALMLTTKSGSLPPGYPELLELLEAYQQVSNDIQTE